MSQKWISRQKRNERVGKISIRVDHAYLNNVACAFWPLVGAIRLPVLCRHDFFKANTNTSGSRWGTIDVFSSIVSIRKQACYIIKLVLRGVQVAWQQNTAQYGEYCVVTGLQNWKASVENVLLAVKKKQQPLVYLNKHMGARQWGAAGTRTTEERKLLVTNCEKKGKHFW